jgi:glycosyltransferase involved in cell wall biosynthesis
MGIVYQLNKGIDLANGEFIARLDSDDIMLPHRLETQLNFLLDSRNVKVEILGSDAIEFGESENPIQFKNYEPAQISFLLNFCCPLLHPTVMMRSVIFKDGLRYSENYPLAEDFALWRVVNNGDNIAILNQVLTKYRIHKNQTNKSDKRQALQKDSFQKVLRNIVNKKGLNLLDIILLLNNKSISRKTADYIFNSKLDGNLNWFVRKYISTKKKKLGLKSGLLNHLAQGC